MTQVHMLQVTFKILRNIIFILLSAASLLQYFFLLNVIQFIIPFKLFFIVKKMNSNSALLKPDLYDFVRAGPTSSHSH